MATLERISRRRFFADLGYTPHDGQWAVHDSTAPRRVLAAGVRWGKTKCAAMEGLTAALEPRERSIGWVVAPTYDLADRVFREIQVVALEKLRHRVIAMKESERRLVLRNLAGGVSEIRAKSADNPVSLLGEGLDFVIVDEAARLRPDIWQGHLVQRLLDKKGWALLISTPRGKGLFFDLYKRGQGGDSDYASWNCPSWTNPFLDKSVIDLERGRLPERTFNQEYGAQFTEGSGQVFRYVRESATGSLAPPQQGVKYHGGLDLAKTEDFTVYAIFDSEKRLVFFDRFQRLDWGIQVARISTANNAFNRAITYVDSTGKGEPVFEHLRLANCRVEPYVFSQASKAALINNLALLLEQRVLVLPTPDKSEVLLDELESFQFSVSDAGSLKTGAPGGSHDDCVIALALAAWHFKPRPKHLTTSICFA